jgi:hypothetical protein
LQIKAVAGSYYDIDSVPQTGLFVTQAGFVCRGALGLAGGAKRVTLGGKLYLEQYPWQNSF